MARSKTEYPITELHGAVEEKGIIHRQKTYRDADGKIIAKGVQEAYKPHKRDFKKHPPVGDELQHHLRFQEACRQTKLQLADPQQRARWQARFDEQLTHATSDTPEQLVDGHRKTYHRLDTFVRAVIYRQLKSQS